MSAIIQLNLKYVNLSESRRTENRNVKSEEADERIVFDVTDVLERDMLNVSWAKNHRGATCQTEERASQKSLLWQ